MSKKKETVDAPELASLTMEEKEALAKDLELIGQVMGTHDQSIFQLIAAMNAVQELLISKDIISKEDIIGQTEIEVGKIQEKFTAAQERAEAAATAEAEEAEESVIITPKASVVV